MIRDQTKKQNRYWRIYPKKTSQYNIDLKHIRETTGTHSMLPQRMT